MLVLYRRHRVMLVALALLSVAGGVLASQHPALVVALLPVTMLLAVGLTFREVLPKVFLTSLGVVLIGYAFFGRPFAYLGVPPIFIGEIVLVVGIAAAIYNRRRWAALGSPVSWVLAALGVWGALRTLPYYSSFGTDALRDGVMWGYGMFALLLVPLLVEERRRERILEWFAACTPWFLLWVPIAIALSLSLRGQLPFLPGTTVPILVVKAGDFSVHLGGIAAFLLLGLHRRPTAPSSRPGVSTRILLRTEPLWWLLWLAGFLAAASLNRGGMLAVFAALAVVLLLRPAIAGRRLVWIGGIVLLFVVTLIAFDVSFETHRNRTISPRQLVQNVVSVASTSEQAGLAGTRRWRLLWWDEIVGYTVHGRYFWTGKGFGINLAADDGFGEAGGSLRSPHNSHLTLLARSGVPGAALWFLLQASFAVALVMTHLRARRQRAERAASMSAWVLAYWAAFMVNATFDVVLEGPQAGIWFWSVFGLGLALTLRQKPDQAPAHRVWQSRAA